MILTAFQLFVTLAIGVWLGFCAANAFYTAEDNRARIDGGHTKGRPRQSIPPRVGRS